MVPSLELHNHLHLRPFGPLQRTNLGPWHLILEKRFGSPAGGIEAVGWRTSSRLHRGNPRWPPWTHFQILTRGRSPRLVVDSIVSGVTSNTLIPNRMLLPRISDVPQAAPTQSSQQEMVAFSLDVCKAHWRIKIGPSDGGFLRFWYQGKLYRCSALNFGARASGYFWGRVACLMVWYVPFTRYSTFCVHYGNTSMAYWLSWNSVWISMGIPMSWHKTMLGSEVTWTG